MDISEENEYLKILLINKVTEIKRLKSELSIQDSTLLQLKELQKSFESLEKINLQLTDKINENEKIYNQQLYDSKSKYEKEIQKLKEEMKNLNYKYEIITKYKSDLKILEIENLTLNDTLRKNKEEYKKDIERIENKYIHKTKEYGKKINDKFSDYRNKLIIEAKEQVEKEKKILIEKVKEYKEEIKKLSSMVKDVISETNKKDEQIAYLRRELDVTKQLEKELENSSRNKISNLKNLSECSSPNKLMSSTLYNTIEVKNNLKSYIGNNVNLLNKIEKIHDMLESGSEISTVKKILKDIIQNANLKSPLIKRKSKSILNCYENILSHRGSIEIKNI